MKYSDLVIGNSSSGIFETPSFKIPTINIGNRQKGRIKANNIVEEKTENFVEQTFETFTVKVSSTTQIKMDLIQSQNY